EFKKLVQQSNLLAQMGFWQVYAMVIVVVDTREQNAGKITYSGLPSRLHSVIENAVSPEHLHERAGLVEMNFTQPMDHAPLTVGTQGLNLRRPSKTAVQSKELTEWVAGIFAESL